MRHAVLYTEHVHEKLMKITFWAIPLTLVLPKSDKNAYTHQLNNVGIMYMYIVYIPTYN